MNAPYLLGVDGGTSLVKSVVFDQKGAEVAVARRPTPVSCPRPTHSELDMTAAWEATADTIAEVVAAVGGESIAAVGITGTADGVWPIDEHGDPTRAAILWNDGRAADLLQAWQQIGTFRRIFEVSGNAPFPGFQLVSLRWLHEHEPEVLARTRWLLFHKDWLRFKLTGAIHAEESDVAYAPGDIRTRGYSDELLGLLGVASYHDRLPPVVGSSAIVGAISSDAAARTGLRSGTPVVAGAVDVVASTLGGGACRPGQACSILGTSFLNSLVVAEPSWVPRESGVQSVLPNGTWLRSLVNTSGTMSIDWMRQHLAHAERAQAAEQGADVFVAIEATVSSVPPGSRGVIFLPYLNSAGMISPFAEPSARAVFFGLSAEHGRAEMLRAVYEGTALAMRDCYDAIGAAVDEVILVGGGARSALWCQMFADVTERRILVAIGSEFGAKGAAMLAGVGCGAFASIEQATASMTEAARAYEPNPATAPAYRAAYQLYQHLYSSIRETWRLRQRLLADLEESHADRRA